MNVVLSLLKDHWQVLVIGALLIIVMLLNQRIDLKTAEHDAYVARVEAASEQAKANKAVVEKTQADNLRTIEENHDEKHVEAVRAGAVDAVRRGLRKPASGGGSMPGIAIGKPAHDGESEECRAAFVIVADAAEDADTLSMWQEWARLNNIPVVNK